MGIPDEHMQLGKSIHPAKLPVLSLVKDARNAFFEEHAFQLLPCFRGIELVNPLSPVIVFGQTRRGGTLADSTDVLNKDQDSAMSTKETDSLVITSVPKRTRSGSISFAILDIHEQKLGHRSSNLTLKAKPSSVNWAAPGH